MTDGQIALGIIEHAKKYQSNLENKNIMFVFENRDNKSIDIFETEYPPINFLHLTGVNINRANVTGAYDFYKLAIKGELNPSHFIVKDKGKVERKIEALSQTMSIHKTGKEIGDFYGTGGKLYTEKLSGNVFACLGYRLDDTMYVPDTNLKDNIRLFTAKPHPILVTLRKNVSDEKYTEITHVKKGLDFSTVMLPAEILAKLSDEAKTALGQALPPSEKNTASPTAEDFTVTRHIGGTFTIALGGVTRDYELLRGADKETKVAETISKDFGCAFEVGKELFDQAAEQNAVEQEAGETPNAPKPQELFKDEKETEIST